MPDDIQPKELTLIQLLEGRLFRIPEYQRAYSWTSSEREDLFGDIEKVDSQDGEGKHFMATVVCLRKGRKELYTDVYYELDIVDGQQRLTTLIILLKTIAIHLKNKQNPDDMQGKIASGLNDLLVKPGDNTLLLLQTNHDVKQHFGNFLRVGKFAEPGSAETLADEELLTAMRDSQKFVEKWEEDGKNLDDLLSRIKNHLSFVLYEISDEKLVYTVFEVLNSRGMVVSWFDRLKSILMGKAYELKKVNREQLMEELRSTWSDIYRQIGLRQGLRPEALRFAATLYQREQQFRPLGEKVAVEALRERADNAANINEIARWLLKVTEACDEVLSNPRWNGVTRIVQARLLGVAIHLKDSLSGKERADLLSCWEKVSFKIYGMMRKDARVRVGDYVSLAWDVVNSEDISVEEIDSRIKEIGRGFPIKDAVEALRGENCYWGWREELRYLMFRYEEYLTKEAGIHIENEHWQKIWLESPAKSIEHITPQSQALPDDNVHRLGNLMLLPPGLNSSLKDKPPAEKFSAYHATGLLTAQEVEVRAKTKTWGPKDIQWREDKILRWAKQEWRD